VGGVAAVEPPPPSSTGAGIVGVVVVVVVVGEGEGVARGVMLFSMWLVCVVVVVCDAVGDED
jgi:hypothetical protein